MEWVSQALGGQSLIPHGYCLTWNPALLWTLVVSDAVIALSYFSIPFALWYFAKKRPDIPYRWLMIVFGMFIVACGVTHIFDILNIWQPSYWASAYAKAFTATISFATAIAVWCIMPLALKAPSAQQLQVLNQALAQSHAELENRVQMRTVELTSALNKSHRLSEALDHIPAFVYIKDMNGKYVYANRMTLDFFNCSIDELVTIDESQYFSPKTLAKVQDVDKRVIEGGEDACEEIEAISHDNKKRIFWQIKTPIYEGDAERHIGGLCGISTDITDLKNAELSLRIAATAFESSDGILITDAGCSILQVNSAFTKITGYTAGDVVGKNPNILSSGRHDHLFYQALWEKINTTGTWCGEIWNRRKTGEIYPERITISVVKDKDGKVTNYVSVFTDISESKASSEQIEHLAFYDPLTNLPNRLLLLDRVRQAFSSSSRTGKKGALLFVDLDHFKVLNDTLGHSTGDLLLKLQAERLSHCVRAGDTVARFGGDEFVVVLEDLDQNVTDAASIAEQIGNKILLALHEPCQFGTHQYQSTSSIGITLFNGDEHDIEELLKQADISMYQAKKAGRNTLRFFDPAMQEKLSIRASLESELRYAIEKQQLALYYQIQVDDNHRLIGAEALIRWIHPERGIVSPMEFIPIAEESALILDIGHWVIDTACCQLAEWAKNADKKHLIIAVNVSAHQFRALDFVQSIHQAIEMHKIDASRLKLELTESVILEDVDEVIARMHALKALGVRLSLDDFGTGYSSLSYLKKLPLDQVKIDQSFVRDLAYDPNDAIMVKTIIDLANNFRINVIAEGVETELELTILKDYGCRLYQGYLFGKPVPIEQFQFSIT
ncbi:bifunctional diguanylate cyclase/phosphodiesterase [Methylotenera sp. L2L1]|uniref:bifunctional diguanylate cyclase/phosphodiesterase n=1 Tax=Methylotenera sp. L2L1 TaxID=1502770 RepID=UPI0005640C1F|nr:bifunctional diguanylate cyclase/phosphodiesterase [Methylotenera sp. L2L1]